MKYKLFVMSLEYGTGRYILVSLHSNLHQAETAAQRINDVLKFVGMNDKFKAQITVHGANHSKPGLTGSLING